MESGYLSPHCSREVELAFGLGTGRGLFMYIYQPYISIRLGIEVF